MWISWKHEDTDFSGPLTFEQKVDLFYEQTLGWQLHIADLIANGGTAFGEFKQGVEGRNVIAIRHSGFAVLHICLSYFELVGSMVTPQTSSTARFNAGVRHTFPGLFKGSAKEKALLARLYKGARCGLYHTGRTRQRVGLGSPSDGGVIGYNPASDGVSVSPELLPKALKAHLDKFRLELLNPSNGTLRKRFQDRFDSGFA